MNDHLKSFANHSAYSAAESQLIKPNVSYCIQENEIHYKPYVHDYSSDYFTTKALENGTISFTIEQYQPTRSITSISYSKDNGQNWTTVNNSDDKEDDLTISVNVISGENVIWKGIANYLAYDDGDGWSFNANFSSTSQYEVCGNIMSLLYGDNFSDVVTLGYSRIFGLLFENSTYLVHSKNLILPATTLSYYCYEGMFYNCTSLVDAPELPATTLKGYCYRQMFYNCSSLIKAPELPTTEVTDNSSGYCYASMFYNCTSLTEAPFLPIYRFNNDATTLGNRYQYSGMFEGCSNLNYIKCYLLRTVNNSTLNWVTGVAENGIFVTSFGFDPYDVYNNNVPKPSGWTIVYNDPATDKYYLDIHKQIECDDHGTPIN